jgi:dTDP-4-amino-4,6-dideoxygalactose transaminase
MAGANPSWHIYIVRLNLTRVKKSKRQIFTEMKERGVTLNLHYIPVHTQPYYAQLGHKPEECPVAMQYYREAFTLPLYYTLTEAEQDEIVGALREVLA